VTERHETRARIPELEVFGFMNRFGPKGAVFEMRKKVAQGTGLVGLGSYLMRGKKDESPIFNQYLYRTAKKDADDVEQLFIWS
jgi:hypothetical protein